MPSIYQSLTAFNKNRLPEMVKIKYKIMSENAFSFFRGTCHLFYRDLEKADPLSASPLTWISGDLHLENFGSFKGDNHQVYFDLNDFDEALLAPAAWELVRMLTSIFVAFDNLELEEDEAFQVAQLYLNTYAATLKKGKAIGIDPRVANGIVCTFLTDVEKRKQKEFLKKHTEKKKGKLFITRDDKHLEIEKPLRKELQAFVNEWMKTSCFADLEFTAIDSVFRIAGTGSIGVKRYLFLLESQTAKNKFLCLDMKEAFESSVLPYVEVKQPDLGSEAERVIAIKHRMQYVSPALLGAATFNDEPYILQQMQPMEDKINFELIKRRHRDVDQVIEDMAKLTASAHLRSSGRQGSAIADELIAFAQIGQWQKLLTYAIHYAKQVKLDYQEFMMGYHKGKY
jgi:uncharacterized protein (DUF2252 family)